MVLEAGSPRKCGPVCLVSDSTTGVCPSLVTGYSRKPWRFRVRLPFRCPNEGLDRTALVPSGGHCPMAGHRVPSLKGPGLPNVVTLRPKLPACEPHRTNSIPATLSHSTHV